jgi:hypothetical protein
MAAICSAEVLNVPDDFDTIQEAIDNADHGDSVMVSEGVYEENIDFNDINVRVIGNPDDPSETTIDGGEDDCVVKIGGGQSNLAVLDGFTLRNGSTDGRGGGGVYSYNGSRPTLRNLIINNCYGTRGGGILCWDSNASISNVRLTENTAQAHGGGICLMARSGPTIVDVIISNNTAETGDGGGIANYSGSNVTVRGGLISENTARRSGGGVYSQAEQISIVDMVIRDNVAREGKGGGVFANGHIVLGGVIVMSNSSAESGGGVYMNGRRPRFEQVAIIANESSELGGGIYITGDVAGNSSPDLINVTIANNTAETGGGIYCFDNGNPNLNNAIVWGNEPEQIVFSGEADANSLDLWYSDIQDGVDGIEQNDNGEIDVGEGNIETDPLLENPEELNFRLGWANFPEDDETKSPCIDTGNPNLDEDPDGTRGDIGGLFFHQDYPAIAVNPPVRIEFGEARPAEQDSVNRPITIANTGTARLIGALSIVPENSPFIIQRQNMAYGVQPGSDIIVVITFKPEERGEYEARLHITHNDPNRDEVVIALTGSGSNSPPEIIGEIDSVAIIEDSDWTFVAELIEIFEDPDGDELGYEFTDNEHLNIGIRDNTLLFISPDRDFNGQNIEYTITARDEFDDFIGLVVALTILPLNDPPAAFNLQSPESDFTINERNQAFDWQTAAQNRWEIDEVTYMLNFYSEAGGEVSMEAMDSIEEDLDVLGLLASLGLTSDDMPTTVHWDVDAFDDSSSVRSEQRWEFVIDVLSVQQPGSDMPTEFALYPSFPNPFNPTTTVRYGTPTAGNINITVYNSVGAMVDRIFNGAAQPGIYTIQWNAKGMPPGLYLISLTNGETTLTQKVTLIK